LLGENIFSDLDNLKDLLGGYFEKYIDEIFLDLLGENIFLNLNNFKDLLGGYSDENNSDLDISDVRKVFENFGGIFLSRLVETIFLNLKSLKDCESFEDDGDLLYLLDLIDLNVDVTFEGKIDEKFSYLLGENIFLDSGNLNDEYFEEIDEFFIDLGDLNVEYFFEIVDFEEIDEFFDLGDLLEKYIDENFLDLIGENILDLEDLDVGDLLEKYIDENFLDLIGENILDLEDLIGENILDLEDLIGENILDLEDLIGENILYLEDLNIEDLFEEINEMFLGE